MVYKASPVFLDGLEDANNSLLINGIAAITSADCFIKFLLVVIAGILNFNNSQIGHRQLQLPSDRKNNIKFIRLKAPDDKAKRKA
jgi:hypothetical protein